MNDIKTLHESITQIDIKGIADLAHVELVDEIAYFPYTDPNNYSKIGFPKKVAHDYSKDYLTFEITNGGTILYRYNRASKIIEYSKNGGEWLSLSPSTSGTQILVNTGDKLRFKFSGGSFGDSEEGIANSFETSVSDPVRFTVSGNLMSLVDGDNFLTSSKQMAFCNFFQLFDQCYGLTDISNLIFPDHVSGECYKQMFRNCGNLVTGPTLPAKQLVTECYSNMFSSCQKLNYIKCLATDISAVGCTTNWLSNVASTGTFVGDPSTAWQRGANGIPEGWTTNTNDGLR